MSIDLGASRRVFASYAPAPLGTRAYVAGRLVVAPLAALGGAFAGIQGRVLSLGCGLGVVERYLAEVHAGLRFEGIDLDAEKVELVAATASRSPRVHLERGDATTIERPPTDDGVLVCDLLHHLDLEGQQRLAAVAMASLRPGGVCIVKDLDVDPHWKHEWNRVHDRLVAGPEPIHCRRPGEMADTFTAAGLVLDDARRIDRPWTPYAHYLLRLHRPPG